MLAIVGFRLLQGAGGAAVIPVGMALMGEYFPAQERGKVVGVWGISAGAAAGIGPSVGGWILDLFGWRAIFHFSVIAGLVSILPPLLMLPGSSSRRAAGLDFGGAVGLFCTVGPLLILVSQGGAWGWTSTPVVALIVTLVIGLVALVAWEKRAKEPIVDPDMVTSPLFLATTATAFLLPMAYWGILFLAPFFLMEVQHFSGGQVGLLLLVFFMPMVVVSPIGGWVADRVKPGTLVVWGMVLSLLGVVPLVFAGTSTPVWYLAASLLVCGIGVALALPPMVKIVITVAPSSGLASATGTFNMLRLMGGPFGVALTSAVYGWRSLARGTDKVAAFGDSFLLAVGISVIGVVAAFLVRRAQGEHAALAEKLSHREHIEMPPA